MPGIGEVLTLPAPEINGGPVAMDQQQQQQQPDATTPSSKAAATVATHTKSIGMILPPPDVRSIIDKTASFVARNGVDFEKKIMASEQKNVKFNFLMPTDPYHAYYQHKIAEDQALQSAGPVAAPQQKPSPAPAQAPAQQQEQQQQQQQQQLPPVEQAPAATNRFDISQFIKPSKELERPADEVFLFKLPEGLTGQDFDVMKLTAQFVARNGKAFFAGLNSREHNSAQFSFLRPTHSLYHFFTALTESYSKLLLPPIDIVEKLKADMTSKTALLERCLKRLEWEKSQEKAKQKAEDDEEYERALMTSIDWSETILVETIDFLEEEDDALPAPVTLDDVIRKSKSLTDEEMPAEPVKEVEMEMDEEEAHHVEEGLKAAARIQDAGNSKEVVQVIVPTADEPMKIVKNWKRPEERVTATKDPTKFAVSPVTHEMIPVNEMAEHMRIALIDPKYKEQKEKMMAKLRESTLASDDEISRNLMGLSRLRPDIFGTTEQEISNAVKAEIEKKKEEPKQVIWDGHSGSINRTASQAMAQNAEEWDASAAVSKAPKPLPPPAGLAVNIPRPMVQATIQAPPAPAPPRPMYPIPGVTRPMPGMPIYSYVPGMPVMALHPFHQMMPPLPDDVPPPPADEPENKRQKLDENLIPEDQFLLRFPGLIPISVALPNVEGEGNLKGQVIHLSVCVSDTVSALKEKLAGEVSVPSNKQKLSGRPGFLKDNLTLARYNLGPGETLTLSLRERGGKKK